MHLKVFMKLKKKPKKPLVWAKKPKKKQKTQKNPKKTHWAGFKKKNRIFSNPVSNTYKIWGRIRIQI